MFEYFRNYYRSFGIILIITTICLTSFYWIIANWSIIRSTYRCVNLKNTLTGSVGKCFDSVAGPTCQKTDLGYIYGWCNDEDNYGALPGNKSGPYSGNCTQWVWSEDQCPPSQCYGNYPNGIGNQCDKQWGWCNDNGVQRAMLGTQCGPMEGKCDKWIWEVKKCPTGCTAPLKPQKIEKKKKIVDKCVCNGPPINPWRPYDNKHVRIRSKDGDCEFKHSAEKGGVPGVGSNNKVAKFNCSPQAKSDVILLEKSRDGHYRMIDADGCTLRWSGRKGGNDAIGTEERVAKFDCDNNAGDPLILEGTPDKAEVYARIKGQKCGLQWSSVKGNVARVSRNERIAKFDCHDKADTLIFDMA